MGAPLRGYVLEDARTEAATCRFYNRPYAAGRSKFSVARCCTPSGDWATTAVSLPLPENVREWEKVPSALSLICLPSIQTFASGCVRPWRITSDCPSEPDAGPALNDCALQLAP